MVQQANVTAHCALVGTNKIYHANKSTEYTIWGTVGGFNQNIQELTKIKGRQASSQGPICIPYFQGRGGREPLLDTWHN